MNLIEKVERAIDRISEMSEKEKDLLTWELQEMEEIELADKFWRARMKDHFSS